MTFCCAVSELATNFDNHSQGCENFSVRPLSSTLPSGVRLSLGAPLFSNN